MNKNHLTFALIAMIAINIYSLITINNLKDDLRAIEASLNHEISMISDEVSRIYSNIDRKLEEQSSLILNTSYDLGDINLETLETPVSFTITPKQLTDDTAITIVKGEELFPLQRNDFNFTGIVPFNFEDVGYLNVIVTSNGVEQLEDLGVRIDVLSTAFPRIYPYFHGETTYSLSSNEYKIDGPIMCELPYSTTNVYIENIDYILKIDGEVVLQNPLTKALNGLYEMDIEETITVNPGQIVTISVVARDNLGFNYDHLIHHFEAGSNSQREPYFETYYIYAPNGELAYSVDENSYERIA